MKKLLACGLQLLLLRLLWLLLLLTPRVLLLHVLRLVNQVPFADRWVSLTTLSEYHDWKQATCVALTALLTTTNMESLCCNFQPRCSGLDGRSK